MLPFIFDDYEHVYRTLDGPSLNWLSPLAEKEGFIILSNWEWGFRNLTNNKRPIMKPEDVRGLKIRTPLTRMGIDPVHFGVVMTLNLMVGLLTPPVGMVLYAVSSVGRVFLSGAIMIGYTLHDLWKFIRKRSSIIE